MAIPCFAQMPSSSTMLVLHLSTTRIFILYLFELKFLHRWIYSCLLHYVYLGFIPTTHVYLYNITIDYIVLNVYKQYNMHMRGIVWSQGQIQNFVLVCHMFKIKTTHWHLMHPVKIDFLAGNCCASDMSFLKCDILAKKRHWNGNTNHRENQSFNSRGGLGVQYLLKVGLFADVCSEYAI